MGRFGRHSNVSERVLEAPHAFLWDQVSVPLASRRDKIDVLLHPKFTVPLLAQLQNGDGASRCRMVRS